MTEQPPGEAAPRPRRGLPRGRGAESRVRVALVLLLLAIAAQGLSGRRHLDWAANTDGAGSNWVGLVLTGAATFVVVTSFRTLRRMLRVTRESDDEHMASIEGSRVTWFGYLAAAAVIAVTIFLVYLLVKSVVDVPVKLRDLGQLGRVGPSSNPRTGVLSANDKRALLLAVLAGGGLAVARRVLSGHADLVEEPPEGDDEPTEQAALAAAVAAAEVELDSRGDDTRAAIIASYTAMERQLAASGTVRQASDTPTDFLLRAMAASRVSRGGATRLTELFREARFSTHPMPESARADAARSLARVADDLAHDTTPRSPHRRAESRG